METNRRLYKGKCENVRDLFSSFPLLILRFIFLCMLCSASSSFAQNDSLLNKQTFDLNDPRNLNCPCHKMQKQAEDEFAALNKSKNLEIDNALQNVFENKENQVNNAVGENISSIGNHFQITHYSNHTKLKRKRRSVFIFKLQKRYFSKKNVGYKFKFRTSDCFHW